MIKVLVDTSVWIHFFKGSLSSKDREALIPLLEAEEVAITDIIKYELLIGASSKKEYFELEQSLAILQEVSVQESQRPQFNQFGFELQQIGLLGRYTDLSIAFLAKQYGMPIFSYDKYFLKLAQRGWIEIFE